MKIQLPDDFSCTDLSSVGTDDAPMEYLLSMGLTEAEANAVIEAAGVGSVKDFSLLDNEMLVGVAREAGLKPIPTKKLSIAIQCLSTNQDLDMKEETKTEATQKSKGHKTPDECVVVAIDRSASMGAGFDEAKAFGANAEKTLTRRSRMDAVKQCFYAFRDRTETLDTHHKLGLIQFDNTIDEMLPLTADLDKFEAIVDDMRHRGSTSIYSAIIRGCCMLEPQKNPKTDLRVLVLTDGQSNTGATPQDALKEVRRIGAVVDAILVGDTPDQNLRKIVAASGGAYFQVRSLSEGFELMEAESVVSLRSRRGGGDKPVQMPKSPVDFGSIQAKNITSASQASSVSTAPALAKKSPPKLVNCMAFFRPKSAPKEKTVMPPSFHRGDIFSRHNVSLSTDNGAQEATRSVGFGPSSTPGVVSFEPPKPKGALGRITKELTDFSERNGMDGIHIYADENNLYELKALIEGPGGTPFEGGVFLIEISLPVNYPLKPPKMRFETPIFHCNVSSNGGICLDILKDQWSPKITVVECLEAIKKMMADPDTDYALRPRIAELYLAFRKSNTRDSRFADQATDCTRKEAYRTVEEWHKLWGISGPSS